MATPRSVASELGPHGLHMSNKKEARLIWVNYLAWWFALKQIDPMHQEEESIEHNQTHRGFSLVICAHTNH